MKNIVVGIVASCLLLGGCDEPPTDERGRLLAKKNEDGSFSFYSDNPIIYTPMTVRYTVIDGHEYLVCEGKRRFGITHSPKCDCHSRK